MTTGSSSVPAIRPPRSSKRHAGHEAELIVVGHRGHSELIDLMLGSVASRLVHHSPLSVLVAKESDS